MGGDQGTQRALLESAPLLRELWLEESPADHLPTTRDVYINDALLSSLKTPKSSHILFYDEFVTIWYSSLNARHILPTVTKRLFSS